MTPRPYQQKIISETQSAFERFGKALIVCPTGGGKTLIFSHIANMRQPERTLILAHREELIAQAVDKLHAATGIRAGIEKAGREAGLSSPVVVASIQTMQRRLGKWPKDHFGLVVCDEAHHSISDSWQQVLRHFDGSADVLGVTATPDRGDKRSLGVYYETVASEVSLFDLIRDGFLSRITIKSIPIQIDLTRVNQTAGDYDQGQLGDALRPYLRSIARAIKEHASFRRTLVFVPLICTSLEFVDACREVGLKAAHVDGMSKNRRQILEGFSRGEFDVLSNAMLLSEGYDEPSIDCVVPLRPTRSRSLFSQMVGRGTRTHAKKQNLLLLDPIWLHQRHNLIRPANLVAQSDQEAEVMTRIAETSRGEIDLEALAMDAKTQRHESLRKLIEASSKKEETLIDAMEWCLKMGHPDLADWEPSMKWEAQALTEQQSKALKRAGVDVSTVKGRGHAAKMLDAQNNQNNNSIFYSNLCQAKQPTFKWSVR